MCSRLLPQRILIAALGISLVILVLGAGVHAHGKLAGSHHHAASCRVCKIHEGFSASPTVVSVELPAPPPVGESLRLPATPPRIVLLIPSRSPRAPPVLA